MSFAGLVDTALPGIGNGNATSFAQKFEASPITLVGGIAGNATGGMPISALLGKSSSNTLNVLKTLLGNVVSGSSLSSTLSNLLSSGLDAVDSAFATFVPLTGGKLVDNSVGTYTFANQAVAGNAIIANGTSVSMKMICPVRTPGGYSNKLAIITGLQSSLAAHNNQGGTYNVATPSFYYQNGLMTAMFDASDGESKQAQIEWQLDFYFPLLTLAQAAGAQNAMMSKITSSLPQDGDPPTWSGISTTAGAPPSVGATAGGTISPPVTPSNGSVSV